MFPFDKPLANITEDDLAALVKGRTLETRELEFKLTLPGSQSQDKKEFLADVSSFANAGGGVILYGVSTSEGVADAILGVSPGNADDERLRLEQIVRTGLDPRIPGLSIYLVSLASGGWVFMVSIPRSFSAPHRVRESSKFHSRHSGGKFELDTAEIRSAILGSESLVERIRNFRDDRLARIAGGSTPVPMNRKAKIVFHVLPLASFTLGYQCDLSILGQDFSRAPMFGSQQGFTRFRHTFDGMLLCNGEEGGTNSYAEFYRNGCIECADTRFLETASDGGKVVYSSVVASELIVTLRNYLATLAFLAVEPPFYAVVSFLNVAGFALERDDEFYQMDINEHRTNREHMVCPEVLIDDPKITPGALLKPTLDLIWNAFGWPTCAYYDKEGRPAPSRRQRIWGH